MTTKFRFWNIAAQRFEPPENFAVKGDGTIISLDPEISSYNIVPTQFSGLLCNGIEIYEGDIIRKESFSPSVLTLKNGRFRLASGTLLPTSEFLLNRLEIVGNIFNANISTLP